VKRGWLSGRKKRNVLLRLSWEEGRVTKESGKAETTSKDRYKMGDGTPPYQGDPERLVNVRLEKNCLGI